MSWMRGGTFGSRTGRVQARGSGADADYFKTTGFEGGTTALDHSNSCNVGDTTAKCATCNGGKKYNPYGNDICKDDITWVPCPDCDKRATDG